ncbi:breast carcinoma-amplified sequence 1 isoform 4-T4 [Thomomys bottae]
MGNQMSVPQRVEDQENESEADTQVHKVTWNGECDQNGVGVMLSTHTVQHYDEVDLGIGVQEDKAAASPREAAALDAVAQAGGKNLGQAAKPQAPAAKSRFFLTLSRPVPGRPGDQGSDSSAAATRLDVSAGRGPEDKGPSERAALPGPAGSGPGAHKTPGRPAAADQAGPATCAAAALPPPPQAAPPRPQDASLFHKFFKLDKGGDAAPGERHKEARSAERGEQAGETAGRPGPQGSGPATQETVDNEETEEQGIEAVTRPGSGKPESLAIPEESCQTRETGENSSIMSFFKTLVSPSKAETKQDPEDKDSEMPPTPTANLKSDKGNILSQETQGTGKSPKGCNAPGLGPPVTSGDTPKEGGKEKSGPSSLPLGKLFWKKVVCDPAVETVTLENAEYALQTVDLTEGQAGPEPGEAKLREEESKPRRSSLMAFLRQMSVRGEGGSTRSEEVDGKDSSDQTSNSTEKVTITPEPEPPGAAQKGKEASSKEKSTPEANKPKSSKQEVKDPAQCAEPATVDLNSLQNGDRSHKRPEKRRQSLGGFLKGLGPKRMLDAQVQTDPVCIGPVGKAK